MAKKDEAQLEQVQEVQAEKEAPKKAEKPRTVMEDNLRATKLLKKQRQNMDPDALLGQIQTLKAQLKRAQSV